MRVEDVGFPVVISVRRGGMFPFIRLQAEKYFNKYNCCRDVISKNNQANFQMAMLNVQLFCLASVIIPTSSPAIQAYNGFICDLQPHTFPFCAQKKFITKARQKQHDSEVYN